MAKREEYSIEDLNSLVKRIQDATSLDENEIEAQISRSYGYLAQTRSRGKAPTALYKLLQITFKDALQGTMMETESVYKNGKAINGNGNDLVAAKDQTIAALTRHRDHLIEENERLTKQCEVNLSRLQQYVQVNSARLKTILEAQKLLTAAAEQSKPEKQKIAAAGERLDKLYIEVLKESFETDKG